ncbi:bis-aminopropyl spermidine synthase family protein [Vallitalea pronyensis]|uniref:Bis-aminopropyl spermidine synthase family protein n=1 Tax=Vallitalea pronyensis TaxID=1348613 RepID=A0A8J8MKJ3_9FIRM|nr:bis-aminopropyl spermidine synthase family protein [Vallitalea pronyensis]QUI23176.1 bis-aminopropyl spermidine synthase family protein [Vallitalea pronyensis]
MIKIINYIEEIEKQVSIDEGIMAIEQFLIQVYFENPISNKELARKLYLPIPLVTAIKKEFIKVGVVKQERGITMTSKGYDYVEDYLGYRGLDKVLYNKLLNQAYDLEDVFSEELQIMEDIFDNRPTADMRVDQAHCTYITSLKRSLLALQYNTLIHKKILCVGDDDLVSISLGLLLRKLYGGTNQSKSEIHVIDVDDRYLDYIKEIANQYGLPIICHKMNLRQAMDKKLIGNFDSFYTDPPYTINGLSLFLSRGIAGLKKRKGLPIFFSFAHKSYDYSFDMMGKFYEMGLSLYRIMPKFNEYEGASIIGNIGQIMILNTTSYTTPVIKEDAYYEDNLYTREVKRGSREKVNS